MNVNEVIANRAIELAGGVLGSKDPVHPNDDVNRGQSSNDTFPTAMYIAASESISHGCCPPWLTLNPAFARRAVNFADVVKIGRTHLMDAVPLTLGHEFGAWAHQAAKGRGRVESTLPRPARVGPWRHRGGTGLNTHPTSRIARLITSPRSPASPLSRRRIDSRLWRPTTPWSRYRGPHRGCRSLTKIGNDIRLLGSGPRCGLAELILPPTSPGRRSCRARSTRPSPRR